MFVTTGLVALREREETKHLLKACKLILGNKLRVVRGFSQNCRKNNSAKDQDALGFVNQERGILQNCM